MPTSFQRPHDPDHFSGTFNQPEFQSRKLGQNVAPDKLVASANQPPKSRPFGKRRRLGNRSAAY